MSIYQWLSLLGIPALLVALITTLITMICKSNKQRKNDSDALRNGIQALLRAQMIADYNHYNEKHFAPLYARENFENCWRQYHALGANGVMDDLHDRFMALPMEAKRKKPNKDAGTVKRSGVSADI